MNGKLLSLPYEKSFHAVYYSKKIFDDAGVPYPKTPWTWDDYVATAKKLTNRDKGIYGSCFFLDWEYYYCMLARQRGVSAYKANGSSNYDDPAFRDAMKFMYDLGETFKVQPGFKEYTDIIKQEAQMYMSGAQTMEATLANIKARAATRSSCPCSPAQPQKGGRARASA